MGDGFSEECHFADDDPCSGQGADPCGEGAADEGVGEEPCIERDEEERHTDIIMRMICDNNSRGMGRPSPLCLRDVRVMRSHVCALDSLTVDIRPAEVTLVRGGNGSGKSTLLLALAQCLPLADGRISGLAGRSTALVPQTPPHTGQLPLTVRAAVAMGRWGARGMFAPLTHEDHALVDESLRILGIDAIATRQLSQTSGGQRQRALVAQALTRRADILLLDEPTAAADEQSTRIIHEAAAGQAAQGATVVLASHDPSACDVADRILTLDRGVLIDER